MNDLRFAVRSLSKSPGFAVVAVLTLALGIGANTAIFSVVNTALLRPLPYPHPEQLVRIYPTTGPQQRGEFSGPDFVDVEREARSFAAVAAASAASLTLTGSGEPQRLYGEVVSPGYFEVLAVPPLLGRTFGPATSAAVEVRQAVLSWDFWRTGLGADPAILGRTLMLNDESYVVVGVMPRGFQGDQQGAKLWALQRKDVPESPFGEADMEHSRGVRYLDVLARLRPGVKIEQAATELGALAARLGATYPDTDGGMLLRVVPWHEDLVGDTRLPLTLLLAAVGLVLLIAGANVANLLLARGTARRREVTIKTALGASRGRIARQLLMESLLVAVTGGLVGLGLAYAGLGPLKALLPSWAGQGIDVQRIVIDEWVLAFALTTSLLAGLLAGVAPALTTARVELSGTLREGSRGTTEGAARNRVRTAFVVAQVALSLVLLVAAGLVLRSFARLTSTDPGFDRTRVVTIGLPLPQTQYSGARVGQFYQQVLERVGSLPGVQAAGAVFHLPLTGNVARGSFVVQGRPAPRLSERQEASIVWATEGYFPALRIPLRAGRLFDRRDAADAPAAVVINEVMARRYWAGDHPLGRQVKLATDPADTAAPWMTVVGVVGDVRDAALSAPPEPEMYLPLSQNAWSRMSLVVRTAGDPERIVAAVRREVAEVDSNLPLGTVETMDALVERSVAGPRFRTVLLGAFGLLALALAAIGTYGVVSFVVARRVQEVGVRLALGATPRDVRGLMMGQGLRPVLLGLALGLVAALATTRVLETLLYGVKPWDPFTFVAMPVVLLAVAALAVWLPARRATRVDPVEALRYE